MLVLGEARVYTGVTATLRTGRLLRRPSTTGEA
jgi:hypothetical protein